MRATTKCKNCNYQFNAARAQCPSCKAWQMNAESPKQDGEDGTVLLSDVKGEGVERIVTNGPWDECWGGGIVVNSVTLIGGVAGAGKSTLSLQLSNIIAGQTKREVLYVAAEEVADQINDRAIRLKLSHRAMIRLAPMGVEIDLATVLRSRRPSAVILDSLPGFVNTPQEAVDLCKTLKHYAVELRCPFIVIDHVNKNDDFAGFESLKHEVDTTLFFENPKIVHPEGELRELRAEKNRFGPANKSILLYMTERGLVAGPDSEDLKEDIEE